MGLATLCIDGEEFVPGCNNCLKRNKENRPRPRWETAIMLYLPMYVPT